MTAEIKASNNYRLYSDMFSYSVDLRPDSSYTLIQETVALVEEYLTVQGVELQPFSFRDSWENGAWRGRNSAWVLVVV